MSAWLWACRVAPLLPARLGRGLQQAYHVCTYACSCVFAYVLPYCLCAGALCAVGVCLYVSLQEHELWLQPSSMDAKAGFSSAASSRAGLSAKVPKPDVVLTTYEVVCSGGAVCCGLAGRPAWQ